MIDLTSMPIWFWQLTGWFLLVIALGFVLKCFVCQITRVAGDSMMPGLLPKDLVLTNKICYRFTAPQKGDIVVIIAPDQRKRVYYIKRIIATAGDHLLLDAGQVYLNGALLQEPYIDHQPTYGELDMAVPEGYVFVMGDNRRVSRDSRDYSISFIANTAVIGKAVFRVAPLNAVGSIYEIK